MNKHTKEIIGTIGMKAQYDENAKKLLSNKIFLARILKGTVTEFKDANPRDIISLIEGEPYVSTVSVEPGMTNQVLENPKSKIKGSNTENTETKEGAIRFDIIFYVRMKDGISQIIVNIEAQKNSSPGYALMNRAIFYTCRMISSQKERDFTNSNYDDMVKVYSIWICPGVNKNCLNHFHITDDALVGNYKWPGKKDLFNFIMIGLDCESSQKLSQSKTESELHQFLNILFSSKLSGEEKVRLLDEELDIPVDEKIREELNDMCNLSEGIEEKGMKKGMKKGIETGRLETIAECLRNGTMNDAKRLLKATGEEIEKATELFLKKGE